MLVFQHALFKCFCLQYFTWQCVIYVCTRCIAKSSRPILTQYFPYQTERKRKKLIIKRNYLNSKQSITVNMVQYFNVLFHWKENPFSCPLNWTKGYSTDSLKKCLFSYIVYTETLSLKHQLFHESSLNITKTREQWHFCSHRSSQQLIQTSILL